MRDLSSWIDHFPQLRTNDESALGPVLAAATTVTLPSAQTVFHAGALCDQYLLVISGSVRVQLVTGNGREVVLYRVGAGQSCVLTTSCLIAGERYPAEGVTESETAAVALGKALFERGLAGSDHFRRFVFASFSLRLAQVIARMEEVAFGSIDARLARVLAAGAPRLRITHEGLAVELGTAREVVSRHLKNYESLGLIALHRGEIEVLDATALTRIGAAH
jgi:CRP/FNR family transcriptional regulator, anaerobic regulatory protein